MVNTWFIHRIIHGDKESHLLYFNPYMLKRHRINEWSKSIELENINCVSDKKYYCMFNKFHGE